MLEPDDKYGKHFLCVRNVLTGCEIIIRNSVKGIESGYPLSLFVCVCVRLVAASARVYFNVHCTDGSNDSL